jgi:hypothetical protein
MSDRVKGFCWPWIVPVDSAAVDDTWELSASVSELVSYWRECQYNMEIFSANLYEVGINSISVITAVSISCSLGNFIKHLDLFINWEEIWNLTTVQKIVNIFQE